MWLELVLFSAVFWPSLLVIFRLYSYLMSGKFRMAGLNLSGRNIVITGPTSGIGKETARELGKAGANLWLLCRKRELGEELATETRKGGGSARVVHCDLASLASVRKAAEEVLTSCPTIHVLLCNAGRGGYPGKVPQTTEDGLETVMQSNYFGHFLLTRLLLPNMTKGTRIVNVSSLMHKFTKTLPMDNLNCETNFHNALPYIYSKLAQILSTKELAFRLHSRGIRVTSLHPGVVNTAIFSREKDLLHRIFAFLASWFKNPNEGAQTSLFLAVGKEVEGVSGEYFVDCAPKAPSLLALDLRLAAKLWDVSSAALGLPTEL